MRDTHKKNVASAVKNSWNCAQLILNTLVFPSKYSSYIHALHNLEFWKRNHVSNKHLMRWRTWHRWWTPPRSRERKWMLKNVKQALALHRAFTSHGQPKACESWLLLCLSIWNSAFKLLLAFLNCYLPVTAWQFDRDCISE